MSRLPATVAMHARRNDARFGARHCSRRWVDGKVVNGAQIEESGDTLRWPAHSGRRAGQEAGVEPPLGAASMPTAVTSLRAASRVTRGRRWRAEPATLSTCVSLVLICSRRRLASFTTAGPAWHERAVPSPPATPLKMLINSRLSVMKLLAKRRGD